MDYCDSDKEGRDDLLSEVHVTFLIHLKSKYFYSPSQKGIEIASAFCRAIHGINAREVSSSHYSLQIIVTFEI